MSPVATGLWRYVPALDSLRRYGWVDCRADFIAGLTVAAVAVPQAMAYGLAAGVDPVYGLYTAIVMTAIGAIFDSSRQLINGPTNATSIAILSATAMIAADQKLEMVVLLGFLIGAIQLGISLLKLGDLTRLISHSVVVGFTAGAGTLLVLDQLKNLLGRKAVGSPSDHFIVRLWRTLASDAPIHVPTLAVGLASIALVVVLRLAKDRLKAPLFPELLAVVAFMAWLTAFFELDELGVQVVGVIPGSLPGFRAPEISWGRVQELSYSAFAIALLGLLEALAMAKGIANRTGQRLDLNQQCLSEGLANFGGSFFQCIPGSGSLTRSAINQQAGARTQWSGVWSAAAVAIIMLVFAPWARFIPKSALAGLLIVTAWRMVDKEALAYSIKATRFDAIIIVATAFSAVFVSIEFCIIIGVLLSFALAVPRTGRMLLTEFVLGEDGHVHERFAADEPDPEMLIFGLEGEMFFAAGPALESHLDMIESRLDGKVKILVLRVKRVRNPDAVGTHMLDHFVRRMHGRGVHVLLCGVRAELETVFEKTGLVALIHSDHVFVEQPVRETSTALAVRHAQRLLGRTKS
ncbi:MAG: SulP family inorganic anion transporter [Deltaproteobacteria bacterium]|nr:SulP family inorganic anion transporter [Deltaproteobacteria bacterium]